MQPNPLLAIKDCGQSIWLDYIQRGLLSGGEFQRLIDNDGISGVTSNPAILEKAIVEHDDYDAAIARPAGMDTQRVYEHLAIEDLQRAANLLLPVYDASGGRDGFVSLEVSPHLAYDAEATIDEARRLWTALDRHNSLIKVPTTKAGITAIQQLIGDGININATLLFSLSPYQAVVQAYLAGLETRARQGKPLAGITSVASFFLSRIDTLVDGALDELATGPMQAQVRKLRGRTAIASARMAYQIYKEIIASEQWQRLAAAGANTQRLLWASTSTKDPDYSDVKYVEALIGPGTIDTLPLDTIDAYRDHGEPMERLETDLDGAHKALAGLAELGIDLAKLTEQLEREGVQKFIDAYDKVLSILARRTTATKGQQ